MQALKLALVGHVLRRERRNLLPVRHGQAVAILGELVLGVVEQAVVLGLHLRLAREQL